LGPVFDAGPFPFQYSRDQAASEVPAMI